MALVVGYGGNIAMTRRGIDYIFTRTRGVDAKNMLVCYILFELETYFFIRFLVDCNEFIDIFMLRNSPKLVSNF